MKDAGIGSGVPASETDPNNPDGTIQGDTDSLASFIG